MSKRSTSLTPSLSLTLSLLLSLIILPTQIHAQFSTPEFSFETTGIISSSGTTPFWLQSNRHGMFSGEGSQFLTRLQAHSTGNQLTDNLSLSYGADFIARPGVKSTASFNQGYLRLDGYGLFLQAGRFHNTSPIHDEELGMGSLGISNNASPIPQVRAGLKDWTSISFTRDFIQIKGYIAHGWLGSRRITEDVLLHEKVGHARFGGDFPLNFYGGLAHYVIWGGKNHPDHGDIPASLSDFKNAFFALKGGPDSPGQFRNYMYGDHIGAWDFGFFLEFDRVDIKAYRQFPIETKDNLKFISPQDALTGLHFDFNENWELPIKALTYEFLYTKYQDGPRRPNIGGDLTRDEFRGNENYYNHGLYRTGWVYNSRTIGNALFVPSSDPDIGVFNNRIVAHHLGISFALQYNVKLTTKGTFSRNYGKRWDNRIPDDKEKMDLFDPYINQWSFFTRIEVPITWRGYLVTILAESGFDNGALVGDQFGWLFGIRLGV
ncbi:hypothetical protein DYD21_07020 [Rhodohalobacter sp. SW132]|uniref:capsule assembly Wzi family protein n=1 Tax=Rhodohalobacter sp. SW132 TaxID=2293433 RepID=UPI000E24204B|nr:capsule assembly Wzi family protein [Rhodohalobacter sp. SW132]REL37536.1 hypothetical protein DYD21_07020 [Rhodohalobacter sp. SW132]